MGDIGGILSGVTALLVALVLTVKWAINTYTDNKVKATTSTIDVKLLEDRVSSLESDVKSLAESNVMLSNAFHAEINKILHKLSGGSSV